MQLLIQVPCCEFVKLIKVNCEGKRNLDLREEYLLLTILLWEYLLLIKKIPSPLLHLYPSFFFINKFSLIQNTYKKNITYCFLFIYLKMNYFIQLDTEYSFCPKCGIDTTQFSHEDHCPHASR